MSQMRRLPKSLKILLGHLEAIEVSVILFSLGFPGRKLSPSAASRLTVDASLDKDEGISDEEDPAELRVLLDLNEQESSQLRRKVDDLEQENKTFKSQLKELREVPKTPTLISKTTIAKDKEIAELQKRIFDMEKEMKLLRKTATKSGTQTMQKLEEEKKKASQDAKAMTDQIESYKSEISKYLCSEIEMDFISNANFYQRRESEECHCQARDAMS